jgi:hypothetical protein
MMILRLPTEKEIFSPRRRSLSSFFSLLYSIAPVCLAAAFLRFGPNWWRHSLGLLIPSGLMGVISFFLIVQHIVVYRQKLYISPAGIGTIGLGNNFAAWTHIEKASIRERHNLLSGTDRLLTLTARDGLLLLAFPTSVLRSEDEMRVLLLVRKTFLTTVGFDKGTF